MKNDSLENLNTILDGIRKIPYENITKIFRLTLASEKRPRDFSLLARWKEKHFHTFL
jgi:hypothetical protein